jgi:hypothetical protein
LTRSSRLLVSAAAGVFALALSGPAFGAYNPSLLVAATNHSLGGGGPMVIGVAQNENDDATGVVTVYSPRGYTVALGQAAGTTLGSVSGFVKVGALGGARVEVNGTVRTDNPANHVSNPCSPGPHEAVWILEFTLSGVTWRLPIYVDRVTTAPESAYASARMRVCLPSPYVPSPQGAPGGASIVVAAFSVRGVFTSPRSLGSYAWNGVFVPYTPGTATPNTANAAQGTSYVRLPVKMTSKAKRQKRGKRTFVVVTSCVREMGRGIRGIRVSVFGGATARRANNPAANQKPVASGRTNARGCVTSRARVKTRFLFVRAWADVPPRQAPGCRPTIVPRCSAPSIAPAFSRFGAMFRVRR